MSAASTRILSHFSRLCPSQKLRKCIRTAVFARSLRTAYLVHTRRQRDAEIRLPGFAGTFRFRTGTSDARFIQMLANGYEFPEYRIPVPCKPRTILDIGASIGVASIMFAQRYPGTRIFSFEPLPELFDLLNHNVAAFSNITPAPFGLVKTEYRDYFRSGYLFNRSGGGFYSDGTGLFGRDGPHAGVEKVPVVAVPEAFDRYGIRSVDIIKIDTEGAEYDILTSIPDEILDGVTVIVGEFHGTRNREIREFLERRFCVDWEETHPVSADPHADGGIGVFRAIGRSGREPASTKPKEHPIRDLSPTATAYPITAVGC